MRLFVAAEIAPPVVAAAQGAIGELRQRVQAQAPRARITWIPPQLMHLTLRFIGSVDDEHVPLIADVLTAAIPRQPFDLELIGVGAFPPRGAPRVFWAGLRGGTDELVAIEVEVSSRLQQLGIPPDPRIFTPHLTLGRVRDAEGLLRAPLLAGLDGWPLGTSRVDAITLFESRLSPKGPTYLPLLRTPLWKKPSPS